MKPALLSRVCSAGLVLGLLTLSTAPAKTQTAAQLVDEVIAQVNDDIITLAKLKSESKRRIAILIKTGRTEQEATAEVTKQQDQLIAALIDDQLLVQKGKELGLSAKVEDEVKQRLTEVSTDQPTPPSDKTQLEEWRVRLRTEIMKQTVFAEEVDSKLFFGFSIEELHAYFDAHKDKFRQPETVTISEIFLSANGKDAAQVKAKAEQLVTQLRGGAVFAKFALANSDRDEEGKRLVPTKGGKVGTFELPMLREDIAMAIRTLKVGGVSDPIRTNDGYQILRVDERTTAGTSAVFNQNRVREAMTIESSRKAHEEYLRRLRAEAYIEFGKNYQGSPPRR